MGERGRKAISVSMAELQTTISELEKETPFPNRSVLWSALSNTVWAKTRQPRPLTSQVAMMLAKKGNLVISTPVGLRGRQKGCPAVPNGGRKRKRIPLPLINDLKKSIPPQFAGVLNKAASGSLKAALKLKCLECSNWQKKEVSFCPVTGCVLYHFRPYQRKENGNAEGSVAKVSAPAD